MLGSVFGVIFTFAAIVGLWELYLKRKPQVGERHKKCVFITGCDSGFGNGLALRLDAKGVPVFAGCFTEAGAHDLKQNTSGRLQTLLVDVAKADSVAQAYDFVRNNLPVGTELWGIVNNAGTGEMLGPLEFSNRQGFRNVYEVNLIGLMDVTRAFLPLLKRSRGRVVNVSSGIALAFMPDIHAYLTSKHAVRAFSSAFRAEKAVLGIHVSCVMPGGFQTPINRLQRIREHVQEQWDSQPADLKEEFKDDYVEKSTQLVGDLLKNASSDVTPVVDAYEHALFAKWPRDEYAPGVELNFLFISLLPPLFFQYLLKKVPRKKYFAPDPTLTLAHSL